ncbi:MAG: beta-ketoacyl-ACP synthase II [Firmicutes bacterium]|mgnify:CR=1 FL=1|nr:beta-ketoacyl-ACP synthase II [Bacillota bacterium]
MKRRVVITGIGAITPIGIGKREFWQGLEAGKNGVDRVQSFDVSLFPTQIGAEVRNFDPVMFFDKKECRRMDRFVQFALAAAKLAVEDAKLDLSKVEKSRAGVSVGSGIGGIQTIQEQTDVLKEKGPRRVSPFFVPMIIGNMASGYISIEFGFQGPNTTVVTACATGTHSLGEAMRMIQSGTADVMVAGGAEAAFAPIAFAGFCSLRALSTRNEEPARASRPFDVGRDGFVMGEGAGVVILEELGHALKRGADIYAEVVGYGLSGDAYHITAPDPGGKGAALCMTMALQDAQLAPEEVDYINAHGTSTPLNDKIETLAIKQVFGEHAYKLAVSSVKSMIGHLLGAAGSVEAIACALAIKNQIIPPTINYETPDPDCDLNYTPNKAQKHAIKVALSNSFGFGGTNATLILKQFAE